MRSIDKIRTVLIILLVFLASSFWRLAHCEGTDIGLDNLHDDLRYDGLEFFGSSQITRSELESILRLSHGASLKAVDRACEKLEAYFEKHRLSANVSKVVSPPYRIYVAVDLVERSHDEIPVRLLDNPHAVITKSEKPNMLLASLHERLDLLDSQGRKWSQRYEGGVLLYSDVAANQIVEDLRRFGPAMRPDWLEVIKSDPNPSKRVEAIELLNWSGSYVETCYALIRSIDDTNYKVRTAAVRFIYARLDILPLDFPYESLLAALCRESLRPSHDDRSKSLFCILKLVEKMPQLTLMAKEANGEAVNIYAKDSRIPALRNVCERLKAIYAVPVIKKRQWSDQPSSGF